MFEKIYFLIFLWICFLKPIYTNEIIIKNKINTYDNIHRHLIGPYSIDPNLDCNIRNLAWEYAQHLSTLPNASPAMGNSFVTVFDALRLAEDCNATRPTNVLPKISNIHVHVKTNAASTYYADPINGNDGNDGSITSPFATLGRAVIAARAGAKPASILLRNGTFFVPSTVELTSVDAGLSISSYPGEVAILSGGIPLVGLNWTKIPSPPTPNITDPVQGSILAYAGGGCVDAPGLSNPSVCAPLGQFDSASACESACSLNSTCTGYTWHDTSLGEWARWCYARLDGYKSCDGAQHHYSGWKVQPSNGTIWSTIVPAGISPFDTLFLPSGRRGVKARWPDANPEEDIYPQGFVDASAWGAPNTYPAPVETHTMIPNRSAYDPFFPFFQWGKNGTVANFTSGSYWGSISPPAGDQYHHPTSLTLPSGTSFQNWTNPAAAFVTAFHSGYWGSWNYAVDHISDAGEVFFSAGGWQEARGSSSGGGFYIEGICELITTPGEWCFDATTRTLKIMLNETVPPADGSILVSQIYEVIRVTGTPTTPVQGISLSNLVFAHTMTDFMLPYTVPSGGDWSFHDGGSVRLYGTQGTSIINNTFWSVGGNALQITGYNRGVVVTGNEFVYVGSSAIVSSGLHGDSIDGGVLSGNDFPEGTIISGNLAHEIGLYVKQTGFVYSGISANLTISNNVFFNGPRAGININDGFAGGHQIYNNLGFNFVRETSDHGVFNSWNRAPYAWRSWDPEGNVDALVTQIHNNFFINNYHSSWPIDHDDGSAMYNDTSNFLVWGGSKQYLGYAKAQIGNVYVYADYNPVEIAAKAKLLPDTSLSYASKLNYETKYTNENGNIGNGWSKCTMAYGTHSFPDSYKDTWYNNVCICASGSHFFDYNGCNINNPTDGNIPLLANNTWASDDQTYSLKCGSTTWTSITQAQAAGVDLGSSLRGPYTNDEIITMGKTLLGM